jgi:hypothetical protein
MNMMRIQRVGVYVACAALLAGAPGRQAKAEARGCVATPEARGDNASQLAPEVLADARKVLRAIETIRTESGTVPSLKPRTVLISERELNAYIAYRIDAEGGDILKDLRLKLFSRNRIEGLAVIDLRDRKLPAFIKPVMNMTFAGVVESQPGKVRIRFESLFLEQQRIQPALLDLVISTVSELEGTEPFRLDDWYELPYGNLVLETRLGQLAASY